MGQEILTLGDFEIEKNKFHHHKSRIFLEDVDIEKVLVSNNISSDEKSTLLVTCIMSIKLTITYNAYKNERICKNLSWTN